MICLVTPPSAFLIDARVFVSLGILRVAAVLPHVEHVDLNGVVDFDTVIREHAASTSARIFGLTATTPQMPSVVRIVEAIRAARPDAKIILGGPHVTLVCAARKRGVERAQRAFAQLAGLVDVLVAGDGELAISQAIDPHAPTLIDADDPKSPLFVSDQDSVPFPARELVDLDSYRYEIDGVRATSMIAQLGCPFECAFCGGRFSPMLRRMRNRSVASVVREAEVLRESFGGIMLYDDELNVSKSFVDLMGALAQLDLRLRGFIKAELFTDEQAEAMARAGFRWILVGFESGSPRILQNINKKATAEDNTRCLRIAHKHGLKVKALMSIGHAGESEATVQDTRDWLMRERPDDFDCTIITTYPGTPYFDNAVLTDRGWTYTAKSGDTLHAQDVDFMEVSEFYKGIPGQYQAFVSTDRLSSKELVGLRDHLEAEVRAELGCAPPVRYEASMGCASAS